jgi:hypothetical protein
MRRSFDSPKPWEDGRKGYSEPDEPQDERPVITRRSNYASESERLTYEFAVESNPKQPDESNLAYARRIAEIAQGRVAPLKDMPTVMVRVPGEEG